MNKFFMILAVALIAMLVGCGGGGSDPISSTTVTAKAATIAPAVTNTVSNVSNQEVGRFALSSDGGARINKLIVINEGTADLSNIVVPTSLELWDAVANKKVSALVTTSGNLATFDFMTQDMKNGLTTNFKVVLTSVKSLEGNYGKTLKFTLNSVSAVSVASGYYIDVIGTPLTMKEYIIGMTPPTVLVIGNSPLTQYMPVAKVIITNVDSQESIEASSVTMSLMAHLISDDQPLLPTICLRTLGSTSPCGSFGTTPSVKLSEGGGSVTFNMKDLNLGVLPKNGGHTEFEVYLENQPSWKTGDTITTSMKSITASNGTKYDYVGVPGTSVILYK